MVTKARQIVEGQIYKLDPKEIPAYVTTKPGYTYVGVVISNTKTETAGPLVIVVLGETTDFENYEIIENCVFSAACFSENYVGTISKDSLDEISEKVRERLY